MDGLPLDIGCRASIMLHRGNGESEAMTARVPNGKLRAWIEQYPGDRYLAAFVGVEIMPGGLVATARRPPATHICASPHSARRWVEGEASAFGLPVEWMDNGAAL